MNKWLVKKGIDVTVYTTNIDVENKVETRKEVLVDGVKVWYFKKSFPKILEYWKVGFLPAFLPRHWEYSKDLHIALAKHMGEFDVVHVTSTFLFASVLGAYYARKYKKPYIISPRGNLMGFNSHPIPNTKNTPILRQDKLEKRIGYAYPRVCRSGKKRAGSHFGYSRRR